MIRKRIFYADFFLRIVILCLPLPAFGLAYIIKFHTRLLPGEEVPVDWLPYWGLLALTLLVWAYVSKLFGLCNFEQLFAPRGKTRRMLMACAITYAPILSAMFFYRGFSYSRLFVLLCAVGLLVLLWVTHVGLRLFISSRRKGWLSSCRILVIGADEYAAQTTTKLLKNQYMPCHIVAVVRLPGQEIAFHQTKAYELEDIPNLAFNNGIDDVVLALPPSRLGEIPALMAKLEPLCIPVRAILDFGDNVSVSERLFGLGSALMLNLRVTPAESPNYLFLKRAFDILFSLVVLVLFAPLMLLIALTIQLSSEGPILFAQERVGLNGKIFKMYKFRTMALSARQESDTRWTIPNDPRRTRLGAFLRRTNLDELPQFFNVLLGDMSVVGPRPERPFFVHKFLRQVAQYNSRHYLKVGITGWAQVNGLRGDTSIEKRVEYDLYYMRNWTFAFDLHIVLLTMFRGSSGDNAY
jgi:Undecaprenyl-phosphate glucose phosphotransferase